MNRLTPSFALLLTLAHAGTAFAQPGGGSRQVADANGRTAVAAGVWTSDDGSTVTYEASYFKPYRAVTAADMIRWVPGGAQLVPEDRGNFGDDQKRGFGSGGDQILINGKRLSGKSNDIGSAVRRIQAGAVARIEVIRGTAAGLDVRSEGTLINIVLDEDIPDGAGTWQLHSGFYGTNDPEYDALVSWSGSAGALDYRLGAQYGPYNRGNLIERYDTYYAADTGEATERRDIEQPQLDSALILNGATSTTFAGGEILNLNARIVDRDHEEDESTIVTTPGEADATNLQNLLLTEAFEWELGGDLEQSIGPGTLKTRAIYTRDDRDDDERVSLTSTDTGNVPSESLVQTATLATEAILRSSFAWAPAASHNLELGAEGAQNVLEKDVALFEVEPDGTLVPVDVFNADADVEEDRYELFATHFWQLADALALESAVNLEYSKISQAGVDVDNARSFTYVKPRFDLRWDMDGDNQLRGTVERTVSQLDFADFVASFDNDDDQVDAGNPDLEPEKAWEYELAWERRLGNDRGVIETRLFYYDIEDHIDNVPVTDTQSAAGNIGAAEHFGLTLKGSLRLATLGLEGAVLDASYTAQDTETTDPFTGTSRKMSDKARQNYNLNFRHDLPKWGLNYSVEIEWNGRRYNNDINYRETWTTVGPRTHAGLQYRLTDTVLLWFDTRLVFDGESRRERDRYVGSVADGNLLRTEVRQQVYQREFILGLRGQF